jgi:formimidoylglutamate deiminase
MNTYFAAHALLEGGARSGVRITVVDGVIAAVEEAPLQAGDTSLNGLVLPGMANVHSHAFQRAMAALAPGLPAATVARGQCRAIGTKNKKT